LAKKLLTNAKRMLEKILLLSWIILSMFTVMFALIKTRRKR